MKSGNKKKSDQISVFWPSLEDEIGAYRKFLKGKVLNAGSGVPSVGRDLETVVQGDVCNLDIIEHELIHITSPLHEIPIESNHFDCVFCNAVLEHVGNPQEVIAELHRVLKPAGCLYLAVPFMQPEHLCPTDFQRYTLDGLRKLVEDAGFSVVEAGGVHNVYRTLGWIVEEWLNARKSLRNVILKAILFPPLRFLSKNSQEHVHSIASVYRVVALKEQRDRRES